jgi:hypothetical protein
MGGSEWGLLFVSLFRRDVEPKQESLPRLFGKRC